MRRNGTLVLAGVALLLVVAGAVVVATAPSAEFYWTGLTGFGLPEEGMTATVHQVLWSAQQLVGAGMVAVGLLLGAAVAGYSFGRRRAVTGRREPGR